MAITVHTAVVARIKELAPSVEQKLIDHLAQIEITRRSDVLIQSFDNLTKMEKLVKGLGPDQKTYNEDGSIKDESYSKTRLDDRNKMNSKIEKWKKAIDKALTEKDFADVYNLPKSIEDKSGSGSGAGE